MYILLIIVSLKVNKFEWRFKFFIRSSRNTLFSKRCLSIKTTMGHFQKGKDLQYV